LSSESARETVLSVRPRYTNIAATHRERYHAGLGEPAIHFQEENGNALHGVLRPRSEPVRGAGVEPKTSPRDNLVWLRGLKPAKPPFDRMRIRARLDQLLQAPIEISRRRLAFLKMFVQK
jgi:hypothetical protein